MSKKIISKRKKQKKGKRILYLTIKDLKDLGIIRNDKNQLIDPLTNKPINIKALLEAQQLKGTSEHMRGYGTSIAPANTNIGSDVINAVLRQKLKEDHDKKNLGLEYGPEQTETRFNLNNNPRLIQLTDDLNKIKGNYNQLADMFYTERENIDSRIGQLRKNIIHETYDINDNIGISPIPAADVMSNGGPAFSAPASESPYKGLTEIIDNTIYANEQSEGKANDESNKEHANEAFETQSNISSNNAADFSYGDYNDDTNSTINPMVKEKLEHILFPPPEKSVSELIENFETAKKPSALEQDEAAIDKEPLIFPIFPTPEAAEIPIPKQSPEKVPIEAELKENQAEEDLIKYIYSDALPQIHKPPFRGGITKLGPEYKPLSREGIYYAWNQMLRDINLNPKIKRKDKLGIENKSFAEVKDMIIEKKMGIDRYLTRK